MARESHETKLRQIAKDMIEAGVKNADPSQSIIDNIRVRDGILYVQQDEFTLAEYNKVLLFGIGKAVASMCHAFEQIIKPDDGMVITKKGGEISQIKVETIPVYQAYHPEPRVENLIYSERLLTKIKQLDPIEKVLVVFMISGGGSALFTLPPKGITIDDLHTLNQLLMKCGAPIKDINTIRKHVSQVKGGRFAKLVTDKGATLVSLILSDVIGDDLSTIASGPTYPDHTTFEDAVMLLKKYKIWQQTPRTIQEYLQFGLDNPELETVRTLPVNAHNYLIGNNLKALIAAKEVAEAHGFDSMILTSRNHGEAKIVAKTIMAIAKEIQDSHNPIAPPAALIIGGEMIVTFDWQDRDGFGPNREFVLSSAIEIDGHANIVVAAVDSDGEDGQGKSGAIADGLTVKCSKFDAKEYLDRHNAEVFFDQLDDSLVFTSSTNVNDIVVVLIG